MNPLNNERVQQPRPGRRHRVGLMVIIAVLVGVGAAFGAWMSTTPSETDEVPAAVAGFADAWDVVWVSGDGDAFAARYSEDATWTCPLGTKVGRDAISAHAATWGRFDDMRHGAITEAEDGAYVFPIDAVWQGESRAGQVRVTMEGDLVSSSTLTWFTRASG